LAATSWRRGERENKKKEGRGGKGRLEKGGEGIGPKKGGVGLPFLKCGCPQASLAG